jgi:hypothetical protein
MERVEQHHHAISVIRFPATRKHLCKFFRYPSKNLDLVFKAAFANKPVIIHELFQISDLDFKVFLEIVRNLKIHRSHALIGALDFKSHLLFDCPLVALFF